MDIDLPSLRIVWTTLIVYFIALFAIGLWAKRRTRDDDSYLIGGRRLGGLVASLSYAAGAMSAWSILGVSGIAFSQGMAAIWLLPGTLTGTALVWFWLGRRLNRGAHRNRWVTLTDLLVEGIEGRQRLRLINLAALVVSISFMFYVAAQFQGAAAAFSSIMETGVLAALLLGSGIVLTYTMVGGFWAVSLTDALQAVLMLVAAVLLSLVALDAVGGPAALSRELTPDHLSLTGGRTGLLAAGFALGLLSVGFGPLGQPHLLNRIMAIRDAKDLRRAGIIALTWQAVVLVSMFLLGLCGHILLQNASVADPEQVFFLLTDRLLPAVLAGVLIAAVMSAIMSTADSQLLVAASALSHDLMQRASLLTSRLFVLVIGLLAVIIAYWLPDAIFSRVLFAWNALGAAFGPVVIARLLRWEVSAATVTRAVAVGFGLTFILHLAPDTPGDVAERFAPFALAMGIILTARGRGASTRLRR